MGMRSPPVSGWYDRLGRDLVGVAVVDDDVVVLCPAGRFTVDSNARAELVRAGSAHTLTLLVDESPRYSVTYPRPSIPAAARFDPTWDEAEEDRDFGLWIANVMDDPDRVDVLREEFGPEAPVRPAG